jgi:tetratricopeptide (TPR) repeat protein
MLRRAALFLVLLSALTAAPVDDLVRAGLAAEAKLDSAHALELFQKADGAKPNDAFILQKIAKQYSDMVPDQKTDAAKKEFATHALDYAQRSVALEPTNAVYALSLAICHGHLALVSDIKTKVAYSRLIKEETEHALQLDPNYAWAHHLLGRWHYEVAAFGPVPRFFAKIFYGGIPPASAEEGVNQLRRATELEPDEMNHWVDLGFAYAATGRKAEARATWTKALAMPDRGKHDPAARKRARDGLADLD